MATLPTNFKDDILDTSVNTRRRYRIHENTDGTIELEDATEYSQVGDEFSAGQINATNTEVNEKFEKKMIVRDLDTIGAMTKEGYVPDALALKEVNNSLSGLFERVYHRHIDNTISYNSGNNDLDKITLPRGRYLFIGYAMLKDAVSGRNEFMLVNFNGQSFPTGVPYPQASLTTYFELTEETTVISRIYISANSILYNHRVDILRLGDII